MPNNPDWWAQKKRELEARKAEDRRKRDREDQDRRNGQTHGGHANDANALAEKHDADEKAAADKRAREQRERDAKAEQDRADREAEERRQAQKRQDDRKKADDDERAQNQASARSYAASDFEAEGGFGQGTENNWGAGLSDVPGQCCSKLNDSWERLSNTVGFSACYKKSKMQHVRNSAKLSGYCTPRRAPPGGGYKYICSAPFRVQCCLKEGKPCVDGGQCCSNSCDTTKNTCK